MTELNEGIKAEKQKCILCGQEGILLYKGLRDRLFKAPGVWDYSWCQNCDLTWLNPLPLRENMGLLYADYNTHEALKLKSFFAILHKTIKFGIIASRLGYENIKIPKVYQYGGKILSLIPPLKEMAEISVMLLPYVKRGRLLDVGCGNGRFLNLMRELGWEVAGVEPDEVAAKIAREQYGLSIISSSLEEVKLSDNLFDAITLHQAFEHLHSPLRGLKKCRELLKPGGRLVIVTPNTKSLTHEIFKKFCVHFDAPRHFFLFSPKSLACIAQAAGFRIQKISTSARWSRSTWVSSEMIQEPLRNKYLTRIRGILFQVFETVFLVFRKWAGEELVLVLLKPE